MRSVLNFSVHKEKITLDKTHHGGRCLTAEGYTDAHSSITVLELALFHTPEELSSRFLCSSYSLFLAGIGSYNLMFAPILAALPSIPGFCRERSGGYLRLLIPRCGVTWRCLSLYLSTLLSGGLVLTAGYGLYGLCCLVLFPGMTAEAAQWLTAPVWNTVLSQLAGVFVLGMIAALLPVLLAGWSKNPCFILCTAFAVFYVYCNALGTLSNRLFYSGDMEGSFQVMLFYPTAVIQSFAGHHRWILLLWAGVAALVFCLLRLCFSRRLDKGA